MGKIETYREQLKSLEKWDSWLRAESGLPGPRANLELAFAVVEEGEEALFNRYRALGIEQAPTGSQDEFLAFCGVLGLGKLLEKGKLEYLAALREHASDPRWRIREAVVLALQRFGKQEMQRLLGEMRSWSAGNHFEQRAALATLAHPDLLVDVAAAQSLLDLLDHSMQSMLASRDRQTEGYKTLRKGLGYCWSIVVAAHPEPGKTRFLRWSEWDDKDVLWVLKSNLRKRRMERMDEAWVRHQLQRLSALKSS